MFYNFQSEYQQKNYKQMLSIIGKLSRLFSDNNCPYLPYRIQENVFCKYFQAENLSRSDCSVDAKKEKIGIGLKTWIGNNDQKVAEFDTLREILSLLSGIELATKVSEFRNERIRITKNLYALDEMIYHIIKRIPNAMEIYEHSFEPIDINRIKILGNRGNNNNVYFNDGKHTYHYSLSKNTLYMIFDQMILLDNFPVEILDDPYTYLMGLSTNSTDVAQVVEAKSQNIDINTKLCLRLYSENKNRGKFVPEKSGLNQWNASGRKRDFDELYIPFPAEDRERNKKFFPDRDQPFELILPDGFSISAKVCQEDNKAIMSNPNKVLGHWLLRNVFELKPGTLITYQMLEVFGIDSVIFTKLEDLKYSIDFAELGTYERFYGTNNE